MPDRTQINLRVDPQQKGEWVEYVENNAEVNSLAQLVRIGVSQYINDGGSGIEGDVTVDTGDMEQSLTRLENKIETLTDDVQVVKSEVTGIGSPVPSLFPDPNDVFEAIPSGNGPEDGITPQTLDEKFPDMDGIPEVATKLERNMSVVKKTPPGQRTKYWKEDD
jgi:hypothetical protein